MKPTISPLVSDMGIEYITKSGRCYGPDELEKKKGKGKVEEVVRNGDEGTEEADKRESSEKKDEDELLLQIMKQNEYDVIEQLQRTPARISLLSLILSSNCDNNEAYEQYKIAKKEAKKAVSQARAQASKKLYEKLGTKEGEKDIYRLARKREKKYQDLNQVRCIKDKEEKVLVKDENIKERWRNYFDDLFNNIHSTPHLPTGGAFHAVGGENKTRENEKLFALEERLRAIEGLNMYGSVDVASLRLVPDVVMPPKFKVPDFDKYTGNLDPRIHLATYIAKMSALTDDDRLLVHFFHESLSEAALRWDLQNLVQKDRESFKEYAQRWREKAAEVHPPVTDNELCSLFIETLKAPYFNLMIGNTSNSFSDIIQAGERIEANLRMGRL
ncbi:hypothetical protein P3X46_022311 [Hevea brasiliensis]|uniref:Retrotransposon gag domain-containing protein n=1 Tax=Hevea brasiliensis TaxID=3981 RepID=A0ABQ9L8G6_HEVBR|nr:hypothetical protein P3X46_022311 [Hevea brasiliensis]